jgi:hypothetical protein
MIKKELTKKRKIKEKFFKIRRRKKKIRIKK